MSSPWIPWSERNLEFAPVIGLHRLYMFYPTIIDAFLDGNCSLTHIVMKPPPETGHDIQKVAGFAQASLLDKIKLMTDEKYNQPNISPALNRFGKKFNLKKSAELQKEKPYNLYVRGFRNKETDEAYIIYCFFYVENFVPGTKNEHKIREIIQNKPKKWNKWWSHEGDWEGVSVYFSDYNANFPDKVIFSQHETTDPRQWKDVKLRDNRILAIPALGTHANYNNTYHKIRPIVIKIPILGIKIKIPFGAWEIAKDEVFIYPENFPKDNFQTYTLTEIDSKKDLWLHFKGKWGQSAGIPWGSAPKGPLMKDKEHFKMLADI